MGTDDVDADADAARLAAEAPARAADHIVGRFFAFAAGPTTTCADEWVSDWTKARFSENRRC